jgi:hypothetical protein
VISCRKRNVGTTIFFSSPSPSAYSQRNTRLPAHIWGSNVRWYPRSHRIGFSIRGSHSPAFSPPGRYGA